VRHTVNLGPAAARNTGLRNVRTAFVAFIDSDVVLNSSVLPILLRHFHDEKVALVAPRILGSDSVAGDTWITRYENGRASLDLGRYPSLVRPRAPVARVPGACLVARVDALGEGFSAELRWLKMLASSGASRVRDGESVTSPLSSCGMSIALSSQNGRPARCTTAQAPTFWQSATVRMWRPL
jgi:hypothetical protein